MKRNLTEWECDNPDCDSRTVTGNTNEPEGWYVGTVTETNDPDNDTRVTYVACSTECVGDAATANVA